MTALLCPLHDEQHPQRVMNGLHVCTGHRWRTLDATAQLPGLYDHLAQWLTRTGGTGQRVHASRDPGLSLSGEAVRCRDHITAHLSCWVRIALEESRWKIKPDPGHKAHAAWIATRIDWYLAQPWAPEFVYETLTVRDEGRRIAQPARVRQFKLTSPCPVDGCAGWLVTEIRQTGDPLPSLVWCDASAEHDQPHMWTDLEWLRKLGPMVNPEQREEEAG